MVRFQREIFIAAEPQKVKAVYMDYSNWHNTFSQTIRSAELLYNRSGIMHIEVRHKTEGLVPNELIETAPDEVTLKEWKPRYYAIFINRFIPAPKGTIYQVQAHLHLKGFYKALRPFVKGFARGRLKRFALAPLKKECERLKIVDFSAAVKK
jgi:hypothetical protein